MFPSVIEALVTGAAIGIISCLGGQGVMMKLHQFDAKKLETRITELETKELVLKDDEYIPRSEVQTAMTGLAEATQKALNDQAAAMNDQAAAMLSMMQQASAENAKAVRVAEARAQVSAPSNGVMNVQAAQQMREQIEALQRQVGLS